MALFILLSIMLHRHTDYTIHQALVSVFLERALYVAPIYNSLESLQRTTECNL